ncbi:MAG: hypothetical protein ACLT1W_15900 [Alistipes onderdonkii]
MGQGDRAGHIIAAGRGESLPVDPDKTAEARAKNAIPKSSSRPSSTS